MEMEGSSKNAEPHPQLLDLIPNKREWLVKREQDRNHGSSLEKKLELRLGPPGEEWSFNGDGKTRGEGSESLLSVGCLSPMAGMHKPGNQSHKFASLEMNPVGTVLSSPWSSQQQQQQQGKTPAFLRFPSTPHAQTLPVPAKESPQSCSTKVADLQSAERKGFSAASAADTAVPNGSSQKRTAPSPVVGWPPVRSFRRNLASSASKPAAESQNAGPSKGAGEKPVETGRKGMFVKINMDGIPIGRKVDLTAYNTYEKLSSAVDELFRGLLAAQGDSSANGTQSMKEDEKAITGLLDGSGEYTLVYEDNEGDRMLVGDVPWHMFLSTVKRLRVLKSSEVSVLSLGSTKQEKMPLESASK